MRRTAYKPAYTRNLPHFQPEGAVLFVTIRLVGTLPAGKTIELRRERAAAREKLQAIGDDAVRRQQLRDEDKRYFGRIDRILDAAGQGPTWLASPAVAKIVHDRILSLDGQSYLLYASTLMSNHGHLIFRPGVADQGVPVALSAIMSTLKGGTARQCNLILKRSGQFWQHESYDHVIRDQAELIRVINYVLDNPVKAGLVENWQDWPWTYLLENE